MAAAKQEEAKQEEARAPLTRPQLTVKKGKDDLAYGEVAYPDGRSERVYFLRNPAGAIHTADKDHARERLKQVGWDIPTVAEAQQYLDQPVQRHNSPIAAPYSPDPEERLALLPDEK